MGSFTSIIYQIVFATKYRRPVLVEKNRDELFKYISGILKNKKCHLYQIGGVEDHIHILTHIHQEQSLAALVKDIKVASNKYIHEKKLFERFTEWQEGYGAFTYAERDKNRLINYVANQVEHHKKKTFREEFIELLNEHNIEFDERYLL
jgi:REP element-mobilizing transposase RayT